MPPSVPFGTNNGIAGQVLVGYGTDGQKKRWLEPMAEGRVVASFALTEPEAAPTRPACAAPRPPPLLRLYEGTSEIQKLIVGRELIKRELTKSTPGRA